LTLKLQKKVADTLACLTGAGIAYDLSEADELKPYFQELASAKYEKGKKVLQPQRKYYAPDTGLRNLKTGFAMQDIGFQLENVVYIELLRRGYEVNIGALPSGEIDFIAQRRAERIYIQVCESLMDKAVRQRETATLDCIGDSNLKLVLTRDKTAVGITETGIRIESIANWLLDGD